MSRIIMVGFFDLMYDFMFFFFFFFSSRRRHTRWNCDWSSDVCSSDLIKLTVNERSAVQATPWIFYQFPDLFDIKDSKYQFELIGYKPKKYTGLQIEIGRASCRERV